MSLKTLKRLIQQTLKRCSLLFSSVFIFCVIFFFPATGFAADIEAITDSTDGTSAFSVRNSSNVEQAHVDSIGNIVAKGCLRLDSGLVECTETEGLVVDGNVGVGTVNPLSKLQVVGGLTRFGLGGTLDNVSGTGEVYVQSDLEVDGIIYGDGSGITSLAGGFTAWTDGGPNVYLTATSDNVGIGTTTPATTFEIVTTASRSPMMISSTATGAGDYVIVSSSGNIGVGTTANAGGMAVMNGNVGIGTWSPNAKLQVIGLIESTTGGVKFPDGTIQTTSNTAAGWTDGGTNVYNTDTSDVVGIGTTTATTTLEIVKQGSLSPLMISSIPTSDGDLFVISSAGNVGIGTATPVAGLSVMTGNVGIGTWSPIGALEVRGGAATRIWTGAGTDTNATAAGELYVEGDLEVDGTIYGDGSGITALPSSLPAGGWTDGGTNIYLTSTTDNVGIGTTTPATTFEVVKTSNRAPLMISATATGAGDMVLITSSGNVGIGTNAPRAALSVMSGNVGIGTSNPATEFSVGSASQFQVNASGAIAASTGIATSGGYVQSGTTANTLTGTTTLTNATSAVMTGNVGLGTTMPVAGLSVMNGNIGVGTWSPIGSLEVRGGSASRIWTGAGTDTNATAAGELYVEGDLEVDGTIYGDGSGITALPSTLPAGGWTDGGANIYLTLTTDNVGIGTTTPATTLEVVKTLNRSPLMISATATGAGDMVFVTSSGNVGVGTTANAGGLAVMNGNVGIGTWSPNAKLQVIGLIESTTGGVKFPDGTIQTTSNTAAGWTDGGPNVYNTDTSDVVGIGTTTASTTLEIVRQGSLKPMMVSSIPTADGDLVTITSVGNVGLGTTSPAGALAVLSGNVGIGTVSPNGLLAVGTSSQFQVNAAGAIAASSGIATNGSYVQSGVSPNTITGTTTFSNVTGLVATGNVGLGTTTPVAGLSVMNGNIGVGTWSPMASLEVRGGTAARIWTGAGTDTNATAAGELYVEGDLEVDGTIYGDGSGITALPSTLPAGGWTDGGTSIYLTLTTDNVGIGTTTPATTLEIVKTSNRSPLMISGTPTSAGDFVLVSSSGNVGVGTTTPVGGFVVMNGNAGVGTWSPNAKLQVIGIVESTTGGFKFPDGTIQSTSNTAAGWTDGGTNVYNTDTSDVVGIGTTTASTTLEIVKQGALSPLMISSVPTSNGDYLIMSSSGNIGVGTSANTAGLSVMNGNVGIGTWSPTARLQVAGEIRATLFTGDGSGLTNLASGAVINDTDNNTKVQTEESLNEDYIRMDTGGTERLVIQPDGNVGISTANPAARFAVGPTSQFQINASGAITAVAGITTNSGYTQTGTSVNTLSGNLGLGTTTPVGGLSVMTGNVGIGTWSPVGSLEVRGGSAARIWTGAGTDTNATAAGELYVEGDLEVDGTIYGDGSGITALPSTLPAGGWTDGGVSVYLTLTTDNVGIGTTTPSTTLEVVKTSNRSPLMVSSVAAGDGDYVIVTSSGNVGLGTTTPGGALAVLSGNVGIGTISPNALLAVGTASQFQVNPSGAIAAVTGITTTGGYTQTGAGANILSGNVGLGTTPVGGLTVMTGNVGIGTWSPIGSLEVRGGSATRIWTGSGTDTNATTAGELYVEGDLEVDGTIYGDGSGVTNIGSMVGAAGWVDPGAIVYQSTTTDFVGIGTTNPSTTFEIVQQATNPSLMISSVFNGDGNLMIVHSGGNVGIGTMQPVAKAVIENTGAIDSFRVNDITADPTPFIIDQNGNLGIGTTTASQQVVVSGAGSAYWVMRRSDSAIASGVLDFIGNDGTHAWIMGTNYAVGQGFEINEGNSATSRFYIAPGGNIGIGTDVTSGSAKLSVIGGNVGIGTWLPVNGTSIMNGNVGIGLVNAQSSLVVMGGNVGVGTVRAGSLLSVSGGAAVGSSAAYTSLSAPVNGLMVQGNVGVGTTAAASALTVSGGQTVGSGFVAATAPVNGLLVQGSVGVGTTTPLGGLTVMSGNVGIGTWSPIGSLEVRGGSSTRIWTGAGTDTNALTAGELYVEGDLEVDGTIYGDGSGITALPSTFAPWLDGGVSVYLATTTDNVGIGTTTPATTFEVVKTSNRAPMMVSSTVTGAGDYLVVVSSGNVGIGTATPNAGLSVMSGNVGIGTIAAASRLTVAGGQTVGVGYVAVTAPANGLLVQSSVGVGTTTPVGGLTVMSGNVGIGTWSPVGSLEVRGGTATRIWTGAGTDTNATTAGELYVEGDLEVDGTIFGDGSGITSLASGFTAWTDGGANVYTTTTTDSVGIGTTTPSGTLELVKVGTTTPLMVSSVATSDGDYFVVTTSGNVGIGTTANAGGVAVMNGNVGIGTWAPGAKLQVIGTVSALFLTGDGSGITNIINGGGWTDGGANMYQAATTDFIGIGTTTPSTTIEIVQQGANAPLMISATPAGDGDRFIIASSGNVGLGTSTPAGGLAVLSGNVGIGTVSPNALLAVGTASQFQVNPSGAIAAVTGITTSGGYSQSGTGVNALTGNVGLGTTTPAGALAVLSGNVGVGTVSPNALLAVGSASQFQVNQTGAIAAVTGITTTGGYTQTGTGANILSGNVGLGTTPVAGLAVMTGNVGIGTWSPIGSLEVRGGSATRIWTGAGTDTNATTAGELYVEGDLEVDGTIYGDGSGLTALPSAFSPWLDGGPNVYLVATTDNVGIGTTTPATTFEIIKTSNRAPMMVSSTPTSAGDYLVVVSSGNVGIGTTAPVGGLTVMRGNVGIGTWSPIGSLEVRGGSATRIWTGAGTDTNAIAAGELYVEGDLEVDGTIYGDGSGITALPSTLPAGGWTDGGSNIYLTLTTDNVGIGTTTPTATLQVENVGSADTLRVNDSLLDPSPFLVTADGNVGIGTTDPKSLMHLFGSIPRIYIFDSDAALDANNPTWSVRSEQTNGGIFSIQNTTDFAAHSYRFVITPSGNVGLGTIAPVGGLTVMSGNVGIGTWSPIGSLEVRGGSATRIWTGAGTDTNATAAGELYVEGDLEVDGTIYGDGSGLSALPSTFSPWLDGGPNVYLVATTDNVGIGTTTPATTFEVVKTSNRAPMMVSSTATSAGDYLVVVSSGNVGIGTTTPNAGLSVMSGNVGVGTIAAASRLTVAGGQAVGVGYVTVTAPSNGLVVQGNTGIGTTTPGSLLTVSGGAAVGSSQAFTTLAAPADGLMVQGNVGVGTTAAGSLLTVSGGAAVGSGAAYKTLSAPTDGLMVQGNIGVGTTAAQNNLAVSGSQSIGAGYVAVTAPSNGMIVQGNIGVGTLNPGSLLSVSGGAAVGSSQAFTTLAAPANGLMVQGNVGVGTTAAVNALTVSGAQSVGSGYVAATAPANGLLVQSSVGIGTTTPVGGLTVMSGNVGIGTWSPIGSLEVRGGTATRIWTGSGTDTNATTAGELYVEGDLEVDGTIYGDGSGITALSSTFTGWTDGGANVYTTATSDNVGIGTTTPTASLLIENVSAIDSFRVNDSLLDITPFVIGPSGSVGVGTTTAGSSLSVAGNAAVGSGAAYSSLGAPANGLMVEGAVGIGTFVPGGTLEVINTGAAAPLLVSSVSTANGDYLIITTSGNVGVGTTANAGGVAIMNGNVGIGTWAPTAKLQVVGTVSATAFVGNGAGITGLAAGATIIDTDNNTKIQTEESANEDYIRMDTAGTERMVIQPNGNVGISTANPANLFAIGSTSQFQVNSSGAIAAVTGITTTGGYTQTGTGINTLSGNVGLGTTAPVGGLAVMTGNVGIGTWSPIGALEVRGLSSTRIWTGSGTDTNATAAGELYVEGDLEVDGTIYGDGSGITALASTFTGWTDGGANVYTTATSDNVGIGTTTPTATLLIENVSAIDSLRVNDGLLDPTPFIVDFSGNVGIGTTSATQGALIVSTGNVGIGTLIPVNGTSIMNGNVGIGTWSPEAKFVVRGASSRLAFDNNGTTTINSLAGSFGGFRISANGGTSYMFNAFEDSLTLDYFSVSTGAYTLQSGANTTNFQIQTTAATAPIIFKPNSTEAMRITAAGNVGIGTAGPNARFVVESGSVGIGTTMPVNGTAIMNGNVGIGTWSPVGALEVRGGAAATRIWTGAGTDTNAISAGELYVEGDLEVDGSIYGDGTNITGAVQNGGGWVDGGAIVYQATTTDFVGIGTASPSTTLEIAKQGSNPLVMLSSTGAGDGDYMIVTSGGNVGIGTTAFTAGLAVMNGNVGIGTVVPGSKLSIAGGAAVGSGSAYKSLAAPTDGLMVQGNVGIGTTAAQNNLAVSGSQSVGAGYVAVTGPANGMIVQGNIGVGTLNPGSLLTISGGAAVGSAQAFTTLAAPANGLMVQGNVGVGTTAAASALTISGGQTVGSGYVTTTAPVNGLLVQGSVGVGTTIPVGGLTVMTGNVGIGTWSPIGALEVRGFSATRIWTGTGTDTNATGAGELYVEGDLEVDGTIYGDGTGITALASGFTGWTDGGTNVYTTATSDNVGIGTTTPTATLLIENVSALDSLRVNDALLDTTPFVVDAAGNVGIGTSSATQGSLIVSTGNVGIGTFTPVDGTAIMNGNVGIGTWSPVSKLQVSGGDVTVTTGNFNMAGGSYINWNGPAGRIRGGTNTLGYLEFITSNVTRMYIDGGNVGIGTTLAVAGTSFMNGNVGIGTWSPIGALEVRGFSATRIWTGTGTDTNATGAGELYVEGDLEVDGTIYGDGTGITALASGFTGWTDGGANVYLTTTTDNVGIGTTTASTTFEIVKTSNRMPLMVSSAAGAGGNYFVISSAGNVGVGTTTPGSLLSISGGQAIGSGAAYTTLAAPANGLMVEGNIGVGTTAAASALTVSGGQTIGGAYVAVNAPANGLAVQGNVGIGVINAQSSLVVMGGNVGLGTVSAGSLLSVSGGAAVGSSQAFTTLAAPANGMMVQGNVGVGTTAAASALTISGGQTVGQGYVAATAPVNGLLVQSSVGVGTTTPVGGLTVMTGNVGIGTWSPIGALEVRGFSATRIWTGTGTDTNATGAGELYVEGDLEVDGTIYGDGTGITALASGFTGWTDGGANVYLTTTTDLVGIGTTTPSTTFEIVKQGTSSPLMVSSVATGDGDFFTVTSGGNVGVGTALPSATMTINGTLSAEPSATANITAGGGVTVSKTIMRIQGSGGPVDISANPQIAAGVDGQFVILHGMSNANTVLFENGTGLRLQGGVSFTMGLGDTMTLTYDVTTVLWTEISRVDN